MKSEEILRQDKSIMKNPGNTKLTMLGSLNKIERRNLIELYCNVANLLPIDDRMLFHLFYKHGYSTIEISQLLMKNDSTISRRLKNIGTKITDLIAGKETGLANNA